MTVLVTGASGFVGSAVLRRLIADGGHDVRALLRPSSDRRTLDGLDCQAVTGDLTDPASLGPAVAGCDTVFHAAADYRLWAPDPEMLYRANVEGTRDLMRAAADAGCRRIVYTSTVGVLGAGADGAPADESTPARLADMVGHYKRSKFLAEEEIRRLAADQGLPVVIVNPSTPMGPGDVKPTPTGRLIVEAARGRMPAYVDTGLNVVHVDDVAEGHLLAWRRGRVGGRYILGGEDMPLGQILAAVAALTGRRPARVRLPRRPLLPAAYLAETIAKTFGLGAPMLTVDGLRMAAKRMYFSSAKARRELGYAPRPAGDAIRDSVAWFRANGYLG